MRHTSAGEPLRPGGSPLRPSAQPLALDITAEASLEVLKARDWLKTIASEVSQRFASALNQEIRKLRKECAINPPTQYNEAASLHYSRPVFGHRFQTGRTKTKRSSSGVWYIYFGLEDTDRDGRPDTLSVVTIVHAARPPLWEEPREEDEDEDDAT